MSYETDTKKQEARITPLSTTETPRPYRLVDIATLVADVAVGATVIPVDVVEGLATQFYVGQLVYVGDDDAQEATPIAIAAIYSAKNNKSITLAGAVTNAYSVAKNAKIWGTHKHRQNVVAIDNWGGGEPAKTLGIDAYGYKSCLFDVILTGVGMTSLEVETFYYDEEDAHWVASGVKIDLLSLDGITATGGRVGLIEEDAQGRVIFFKVVSFAGTSFDLTAIPLLV